MDKLSLKIRTEIEKLDELHKKTFSVYESFLNEIGIVN